MTTKPTMALAELSEKGADVDLIREMIRHVAQRMMDMDVESLCAAAYGERSPERANSRNGYRERSWETRGGSVELKIPMLRKGSYFLGFLEPRRTAKKALAAVIQEAYIQVDPLGGRVGQGDGDERHQQKPSLAAVRRDRRAGQRLRVPPFWWTVLSLGSWLDLGLWFTSCCRIVIDFNAVQSDADAAEGRHRLRSKRLSNSCGDR